MSPEGHNPKDLVGAKKAPMDLVPAAGAIMSAPAHQNGADKYGAFNWRLNPVQYMTYLAAMRRHMDALIDGQDFAEDTNIHHLSHIIAGANILADAIGLGNLIDNRPPKGPAADLLRLQDRSLKDLATDPILAPEEFERARLMAWLQTTLDQMQGPARPGSGLDELMRPPWLGKPPAPRLCVSGCGHPVSVHDDGANGGGAWCRTCMDLEQDSGHDPRGVGPCW